MLHKTMCSTVHKPVLYLAVSLEALHMLMCLLHANARQGLQKVTSSKDAHLHAGDVMGATHADRQPLIPQQSLSEP